jgi:hypothetical protein
MCKRLGQWLATNPMAPPIVAYIVQIAVAAVMCLIWVKL